MVELPEAATAARQGARSLRIRGWMGEECDQAALEAISRAGLDTPPAVAYLLGRNAARDELRRLTNHRRQVRATTQVLDFDVPVSDLSLDEIEIRDRIGRLGLNPPHQKLLELVYEGYLPVEAAAIVGVHPSVVTQIRNKVRSRWNRAS